MRKNQTTTFNLAALLLLVFAVSILFANQAFASQNTNDYHQFDENHELADNQKNQDWIPQIPEGYSSKELKHYLFFYPSGASSIIDPLIDNAEQIRKKLVSQIGIDPAGRTTIILVKNADDFAYVQPGKNKLPSWVAGVAYTRLNLVLLRQAGSMGQPINLVKTFKHEMSHIILRQAVNNRHLPKWFVEGLAQYQAGEIDLQRGIRLAKAIVSGRMIPLANLMYAFPKSVSDIHLAYDQSYAIVNYLVGEYGLKKFHALITKLGQGMDFVKAMERSYKKPIDVLESEWIKSVKMSYNWIPLFSSGGAVWGFASVLFIMSYIKRRKLKAERMARWEDEEREVDEFNARIDARMVEIKEKQNNRNMLN